MHSIFLFQYLCKKNMDGFEWVKELGVAVTVCDLQGIVLYMNDKSERTFAKDGGKTLLGKNLMTAVLSSLRALPLMARTFIAADPS